MIFDKVENTNLYKGISKNFDIVFDFIAKTDFTKLESGKYKVPSTEMKYELSRYKTKPLAQGRLETHKKFIDVQVLVKGHETMGTQPLSKTMKVTQDYSEETDVMFYAESETTTFVNMNDGTFCVFYPSDMHLPCCSDDQGDVIKVVVKVPVK